MTDQTEMPLDPDRVRQYRTLFEEAALCDLAPEELRAAIEAGTVAADWINGRWFIPIPLDGRAVSA